MNEKDWMRVADLLCQIRSKIERLNPSRIPSINAQIQMHHHIMSALELNEKLAEWDSMGWL